jgi:hypothetical protein
MNFRRTFLAISMAALLILAGCAAVKQYVDSAQQVLCNPTVEQQTEAANVLNFIAAGGAAVGPIVGVAINQNEVVAVLNTIKEGGCVFLTDLQAALAWFDALTSQTKGIKAPIPQTPALHAWVKR